MRDKIRVGELELDNISLDKKMGFIEDGHRYVLLDNPSKVFRSVTTILKQFNEPFDPVVVSKKVTEKVGSKYYGRDPEEVRQGWEAYGKLKAEEGTRLHSYGESSLIHSYAKDLWEGKEIPLPPDLPKAKYIIQVIDFLKSQGYELAITEMLVYSEALALAGQSDMILKKKVGNEYQYMIFDWKFLSKKLEKRSNYKPRARQYTMMTGPFLHLMDCKWIHYSIQLAIYQTLTGDPTKIKEKVLVVVNDHGFELVPAYPMRVFWDDNLQLQAVYERFNGTFYDSRQSKFLNSWPADIKGR